MLAIDNTFVREKFTIQSVVWRGFVDSNESAVVVMEPRSWVVLGWANNVAGITFHKAVISRFQKEITALFTLAYFYFVTKLRSLPYHFLLVSHAYG